MNTAWKAVRRGPASSTRTTRQHSVTNSSTSHSEGKTVYNPHQYHVENTSPHSRVAQSHSVGLLKPIAAR